MNKCKRCEYEWLPRALTRSALCPRCKTRKWDEAKRPKVSFKGVGLTQSLVNDLLIYDRKTGRLSWKPHNRGGRAESSGPAGGFDKSTGYITVGIGGSRYYAHRLIWLMVYGYLPETNIDHRDRNKLNNRLSNLREVSQACNTRNCGNFSHNTSGVKGISIYTRYGLWKATIAVDKNQKHLGYFEDFHEAVAHRLAAEQCLDWEGCDSSSPAYKFMKEKI